MKRPDLYRPGFKNQDGKFDYRSYCENIALRQMAIDAHGNTCQKCGKKLSMKKLVVHHRHYRTFKNERPEDVVILCQECHIDFHNRCKSGQLEMDDLWLMDQYRYNEDFINSLKKNSSTEECGKDATP